MNSESQPDQNLPAPIEIPARDPDEIISPEPFNDPADFAPLPPPKASFRDVLELVGHTTFVIVVVVVIPIAIMWMLYQFYIRLPFETMSLVIVGMACLWAYRDRIGGLLHRIVLGRGA